MNTYVLKIEDIDAEWAHLKASNGPDCILNFFKRNPSMVRRKGLRVILESLPSKTKIRYFVSGGLPGLKIEICVGG